MFLANGVGTKWGDKRDVKVYKKTLIYLFWAGAQRSGAKKNSPAARQFDTEYQLIGGLRPNENKKGPPFAGGPSSYLGERLP
jgi:hypothetical protein